MKKSILFSVIAIAALSGCDQQLSENDRALITSANQNAQEAKQISSQALEEARAARADANKSAEKADRIFRQGQNK